MLLSSPKTGWIAKVVALSLVCFTAPAVAKKSESAEATPRQGVVVTAEDFLQTTLPAQTGETTVYLGNTQANYLHPQLVKQRLSVLVGERRADALHVVGLSSKGLGVSLTELMNEPVYLEQKHGKLVVVVTEDDYNNTDDLALKFLSNKADYIVVVPNQKRVAETLSQITLTQAENSDKKVTVEVFEGGPTARSALFNIATRARFATVRNPIKVNCRLNYNAEDVRLEHGSLAATEFLSLYRRVNGAFGNLSFQAFTHKEPGPFQSVYLDPLETYGEEKKVEVDGRMVAERVERFKSGRAHRIQEAMVPLGHVGRVYMNTDGENVSVVIVPNGWLLDNIRKGKFRTKLTIQGKRSLVNPAFEETSSYGDMTNWAETTSDAFPGPVFVYEAKLKDFEIEVGEAEHVLIDLKLEPRFVSSAKTQNYYAKHILMVESPEQMTTAEFTYTEFLKAQVKALEHHFQALQRAANPEPHMLRKPYNDAEEPYYADQVEAVGQYAALLEELQANIADMEESSIHKIGAQLCKAVFY